jgi:hypothetical protein
MHGPFLISAVVIVCVALIWKLMHRDPEDPEALCRETDQNRGDRPKPWEVNLLPLLPAAVVPPVVALASGPPQSSRGVVRAG